MKNVLIACVCVAGVGGMALAQPAEFTDLTATPGMQTVDVELPSPSAIVWYRIELPAAQDALTTFVDLWTVSGGANPITDTEIGVYDNAGNLVSSDDDDGDGLMSAMSFGQISPERPAVGSGVAFNGRDGQIDAGVYWIGIGRFNVSYGATGWSATSTNVSTQSTTQLVLNIFGSRPLSGDAAVSPTTRAPGEQALFTLAVSPADDPVSTGVACVVDLSAAGGSATQALFDNGTNGDATAGDNTYSFRYTVPLAMTPGVKVIPWSLTDAESRNDSGTLVLAVTGPGLSFDGEPNESKATATTVVAESETYSILGTSTGNGTTPGENSVDYYRIKTAAAAPGIYKHTLTLTSPTPGHVATIRGLSQSLSGVVNAGTDVTAQNARVAGDDSRSNSWYGFGRQDEVYYRVAGTSTTTGMYSVVLTREAVARQQLTTQPANAGMLTIQVTSTGATTDTELWVLDADTLSPIPGYNNDDTATSLFSSTLTRTFQPGRYIIAATDYNLMCNLPSPLDEPGRGETVLDFADAFLASDAEGEVTVNVVVREGGTGGAIVSTNSYSQSSPFGIVFIDMIVAGGGGCVADVDDGSGTGVADGAVTIDDLLYYLGLFQAGNAGADVDDGTGTGATDGAVTIDDLLYFVERFQAGC
ncbi:MAG: GC-type dockerin domain-anchored protein [Phycisphaerales bacterium]